MKYSILALVGVIASNELVTKEDPPKDGEAPAASKPATPDSNRATYEAAVKSADETVAT